MERYVLGAGGAIFYFLHLQSVSEILYGFMVEIMCVDKQEGYGQAAVNMERRVAGNRAARRGRVGVVGKVCFVPFFVSLLFCVSCLLRAI